MLNFLFGRSGSGKTQYIMEAIRERVRRGERTYLLVPEQQAYVSEAMLADLPASSALCLEVLTFSRLADTVFSLYGGLCRRRVSSGERNLIMWQSFRENALELKNYGGIKHDATLCAMMLSAMDELKANSLSPEDVEKLSEKCPDADLSRKLFDIGLLYESFNSNVRDRLGEDALADEEGLEILAATLAKNDFFAGAAVYIDSFTSFTAREHAVLDEIVRSADETTVAFAIPVRGARTPYSDSITETVRRFTSFARDRGIPTRDVSPDGFGREIAAELRALETGLWDFSKASGSSSDIPECERGHIEMYDCRTEYDEAKLAALKIIEAHRGGVKYSDIAVIMRSCDSRDGIISSVFTDAGIPYFYSEKIDLSSTAAARLILCALRCVSYNFRQEDVLALMKTGLCGIDPHDADLFESYCRTWRIKGSLFTSPAWSMNPDGFTTVLSERGRAILSSANKVREALITPLERLRSRLTSSSSCKESCGYLYAYLEEIGLSQHLSELAEDELTAGDVKSAGEILRLYDNILSALTKLATVMSDERISTEELSTAIEIMLKHSDIASVPAVNEYVTVGSADTLRVENIKVAILLGLCEGEFPANFSERGLLCENDKRILSEALETHLTSREKTVISDELFFAYRAMTRPSDRLILCTCRSHLSGNRQTPSSAWNRVRFLFDYIVPIEVDTERIRLAATNAQKPVPTADSSSSGTVIDPLFVRELFGDTLKLSKTQISGFVGCPYSYWCNYVLELREQDEAVISYDSAGTVIHYVIEHIIKDRKSPDGSIEPLPYDELIEAVNTYLMQYVHECNCPIPPRLMYSFARLRDLSLIMARSVLDELADSSFKVVATEKKISDTGDLKPIKIPLGDGDTSPTVILGGTIDRIDMYESEDRKYLRVVDYKTGSHSFDPSKISTGEDIQLPAYLFTVKLNKHSRLFGDQKKEAVAASALFVSANEEKGEMSVKRSGFILGEEDVLRASSESLDKKVLLGITVDTSDGIKGKNALSKEEIDMIETEVKSTVSKTAEDLYSGKIRRTPSESACRYCKMKATCPVAHKGKF